MADRPAFTFRNSGPAQAEAILEFSAQNGFTPRSLESWHGDNMSAALAYEGEKLVGVIPFSVRSIQVKDAQSMRCGYLSAVAISGEYRGAGLGTQLLQFLVCGAGMDGFMVNSEIDDDAYRWYARNGFAVAVKVQSLLRSLPAGFGADPVLDAVEITDTGLSEAQCAHLKQAFDRQYACAGGFEVRRADFWNRRLKYHYYRKYNRAFLIHTAGQRGYAVASVNSHPKICTRVDILELCFQNGEELRELLRAAYRLASSFNVAEVKCPAVVGSDLHDQLQVEGFVEGGRFDVLLHADAPERVDTRTWNFFLWDYA